MRWPCENFAFDDFARTTLGGAQIIAAQTHPTTQQTESIINYLKSPGSGPSANMSFERWLSESMAAHPHTILLTMQLNTLNRDVAYIGRGACYVVHKAGRLIQANGRPHAELPLLVRPSLMHLRINSHG